MVFGAIEGVDMKKLIHRILTRLLAGKESSSEMSSLASRLLRRPEDATIGEIKSLAASVLSQDETKGKR